MPWKKGDTETARKGGTAAAEHRRGLEKLLVYMASEGSEAYNSKLEKLAGGEEVSPPEKDFMNRIERNMEYFAPKLSRAEIGGKDGGAIKVEQSLKIEFE